MTLNRLLFQLAMAIAPPHRRDWIKGMGIEGMGIEAGHAGQDLGWAVGCLTTAIGQRLNDMVVTGGLVRLTAGGFVAALGMAAIPFLIRIARFVTGHDMHGPALGGAWLGMVLCLVYFVGLTSGGAAILWSGRSLSAQRIGRFLFAGFAGLNGVALSVGAVYSLERGYHVSTFGHGFTWLTYAVIPLSFAAALGLAMKRPRLLMTAAMATLGIQAVQWAIEIGRLPAADPMTCVRAFFGSCLPALVLVSASALLPGKRRNAVHPA